MSEEPPFDTGRATAGGPPATTPAGFDATAAMVRAESEHLDAKLNALVTRLASVPGLNVVTSSRQGWVRRWLGDLPYVNDVRRRSGPIERISVTVGARSYWLRTDGRTMACGRTGATSPAQPDADELPFSIWANALLDDIAQQNLAQHDALVALRRLVEHDQAA